MGEPLLRGRCTCWVWGFSRGCGGWEELDFQPWCQQVFYLPGSALFLSVMWLRTLSTTPHHVWKISMRSRCGRIWGCPHRGTLCLRVSLCPDCSRDPSVHAP